MTFVIQKYLFNGLVINSEGYLQFQLGTQGKQPFTFSGDGFQAVQVSFVWFRRGSIVFNITVWFLWIESVPVWIWHTLEEIDSTWA